MSCTNFDFCCLFFCFLSPCFQVVQLISREILPFANFIPKDFVGQIMAMLNKGSIHSQSASFTGKAIVDQTMHMLATHATGIN